MIYLLLKHSQAIQGSHISQLFIVSNVWRRALKPLLKKTKKPAIKSHDLFRLQFAASIQLSENELNLLGIINEVYIDGRYPGDLGLLPQGKPTISEIKTFIDFCNEIYTRLKQQVEKI
jgi:HEPN domain-containing protein